MRPARASSGRRGSAVREIAEVGLVARVGAGAEFLAAYGAVPPAAAAHAALAPGATTVLATVVEVRAAQADIAVPAAAGVAATGAATFAGLAETPPALTAAAYYRANATGTALDALTAAEVAQDLSA